jgi:enediyne biosynthesis protein E5
VSGNVVRLPLSLAGHGQAGVERFADLGRQFKSKLPKDARLWQILFLASLLTFGVFARDFTLKPEQMLLAFATGLATQAFWLRVKGLPQKGYLSAFVTCFGLSILLRSDTLWVHPLAACLALSAKFVIRINGRHLYNPANLGVIVATTLLPGAWTSPGQWGNELAAALWFVALGGLVTQRARRWDISWVFLAAWLGLCAARMLWLGQPTAVWEHQLGSGALLLFAFFMISDPMTIPNRRGARIAYALIVAVGAFLWQYALFRPNALVWTLFLATPLVPIFDRLWPGAGFTWRANTPTPATAVPGLRRPWLRPRIEPRATWRRATRHSTSAHVDTLADVTAVRGGTQDELGKIAATDA